MGLVDDVDLVAAGDRRVERPLAQVAGVVDATVRRRVDLDDVEAARPVGGQRDAAVAGPAGVGRRAALAVEGAGEDARAGGLAAPARTAEQVGVVDPAVAQRLLQRLGDVLLALDLGEAAGSVLAVERQAHESSGVAALPEMESDPPRTRPEPACPCCLPALGEFSESGAARGVGTDSSRGHRRPARGLVPLASQAEDSPSWPMAHAWKACWGQPLASSNLASSAMIYR